MRKRKLERICTKVPSEENKIRIEIIVTFKAPNLCTIWPTVSSPKNAPIEPVLMRDPNAPLLRPKWALTSGNRGTHAIIEKPKRKKIVWSSFCSNCGVNSFAIRTEHSQAVHELL
jgi:hypothetical protein